MDRIRLEASFLRTDTYREIRYERLVTDPETVLCEVATFLELEPSKSWRDKCQQLVLTRKASEPVSLDVLRHLSFEDIQALNDVGDVGFFPFKSNAESRQLADALRKAETGIEHHNADEALRTAIGVMATRMAAQNAHLRQRAVALLGKALSLGGDDPSQWTLLYQGSREA
jgi:hypothetical protein